ncbi:glucan endo-1,3-beta-glucosidase 3-like [Nicotiana sylvestris]|uniref:glucan endo-1,3-beta-D-glucosidase n=1 Tax=Nicotiana sylvestris TaxID=4096 RepID=A0A1U7V8W3_NICSY|nr:PREDICTED: glucan endo-1,3-beta-glucosidase 3-like [Nicotiana sylvestris]XP_016485838.1 PREDICTED: glucan endo-1,3-beta-glucosidase 3-like [Nicotiana tabacum]
MRREMGLLLHHLLLLLLSLLVAPALSLNEEAFVGVNIGTDVSDMPSPAKVVALLKAQQIRHVRLFDADQAMLLALANTGIHVTVSVPNDQLLGIGQSNSTAANWVSRNILTHFPATNITAIAIGSEVLTSLPNAAPVLVSAMRFIHSALVAANLDSKIKVSTPHSSSIVLDSFPPSQAFFNRSLDPVMVPLLKFLQSTGSYLMLNVYPYYDYMKSNGVIPLDYALFRPLPPNKEAVDTNTLLHYTNVFDAVVDAAYFSMSYLNFTNIPIIVTESGWPSKGDSSEPEASLDNANTYNSNLIRHVLNNTGTPKHPGIAISTYIYELYNEDLRPDSISEKNWGLFDSSGMPVYTMHLTGSGTVLANDTTNRTYCVAKENAEKKMVQAALDWACGPGKVDCTPLLQGNPCYEPNTVIAHASYAFDAYYRKMGMADGTCNFNGVATVSTTDPSNGSCIYPGSGGRNGTFTNSSSHAPSSDSTASGCHSQYSHDVHTFLSSLIVGLVLCTAACL